METLLTLSTEITKSICIDVHTDHTGGEVNKQLNNSNRKFFLV